MLVAVAITVTAVVLARGGGGGGDAAPGRPASAMRSPTPYAPTPEAQPTPDLDLEAHNRCYEAIKDDRPTRPPIDVVLLLDTGGAAAGAPLAVLVPEPGVGLLLRSVSTSSGARLLDGSRVGVATYGSVGPDASGGAPLKWVVTLSTNEAEVAAAVGGLVGTGGGSGDGGGGALAALSALASSPQAVGWRPASTRVVAWVGGHPGAEGLCRPSRQDVAADLLAARVVVVALSVGGGLDAAVPAGVGGRGRESAVAECPPPTPGGRPLDVPPIEADQAADLLGAGVEGWVEPLPPLAVAGGGLAAALRPLLFDAWRLRPITSVHDCGGGYDTRCMDAFSVGICSSQKRASGRTPPTAGGLARTCDAFEARELRDLVGMAGKQPPTRTITVCADGTQVTCVWGSDGYVRCEADSQAGTPADRPTQRLQTPSPATDRRSLHRRRQLSYLRPAGGTRWGY